tara:strand:+ start:17781 stop:18356 length:576 start_codon:yes stop_codon:yes gene_type:complete
MNDLNKIGSSAASGVKNVGSAAGGAAKNIANQGWKAIPVPVKGVLLVAIAYWAYKFAAGAIAKSRLSAEGRDQAQEVDGWNQSFINDNSTAAATMNGAQMKAASNAIFTAMDGYGTDETTIYNQMSKVKNNADYSGLSLAWGRRTISSGRWNPAPDLKNATLIQAISDELGSGAKIKINKILSSAGVRYRV